MRVRVVSALLLLIAGCGIPVDESPETFMLPDVGSDIDDFPAAGELAAAPLYLVGGEGLVRVTRDLPDPIDARSLVESLLSGVTEPEDRSGLSSSIPSGTDLVGIDVADRIATVDLSADFATVGGQQEIRAVAQIVLTVTQLVGVDGVVFQLDGVRTDVPTADGALATIAVTSDDYESLIER